MAVRAGMVAALASVVLTTGGGVRQDFLEFILLHVTHEATISIIVRHKVCHVLCCVPCKLSGGLYRLASQNPTALLLTTQAGKSGKCVSRAVLHLAPLD